MLGVAMFLSWKMPETRSISSSNQTQNKCEHMKEILEGGMEMMKRRPELLPILIIGLLFGLYSEGFDRLWTKHILEQFTFPSGEAYQPVVWLGLLRGISLLMAIGATWLAERRVDTSNQKAIRNSVFLFSIMLIVGMYSFALARSLNLVLAAYIVVYVARNVIAPLFTAWINQRLDSKVRATVLSMSGQVDAVGQIAGGPLVGAIGSAISVRAALLASKFNPYTCPGLV